MYFIGDEELAAIKKLFDEKKRLYRYSANNDGECDLFEKEFSEKFKTSHSLLLSSGTNSLLLALLAGGIQPLDEVLVPTYTFVATASAVLQAGAIPIMVNVDENLSLDFRDAEQKISSKTKAIILVHMDGLSANVEGAIDFCKKHSLLFVEDVAQALGAQFKDKMLGAYGDYGCFSLNENKTLSCGEGGILITPFLKNYETALCLHDTPIQFNPTKKDFFKEIKPCMGFSMRVSEIQGAVMRVQLKRLDMIAANLRKRKKIYTDVLSSLPSANVILGYDLAGDLGSSLHLKFNQMEDQLRHGKKLKEAGFDFAPVTMRPAHASWKWTHLYGDQSHIQKAQNPFLRAETKYNYSLTQYVESLELLSRVIKMDVNIHLSEEETLEAAKKMKQLLTS